MRVEQRIESLGLRLPEAPTALASYVPAVRTGSLVYSSGQLPTQNNELRWRGRVGDEISEDEAYEAARIAALNALAALKSAIGDLDSIARIVRVTGYVNSALGFTNQPVVVNGASDLLEQVFGDAGRHSRVSVGVFQLPLGAPVEVDIIAEVRD